jgi:hypothetical protein
MFGCSMGLLNVLAQLSADEDEVAPSLGRVIVAAVISVGVFVLVWYVGQRWSEARRRPSALLDLDAADRWRVRNAIRDGTAVDDPKVAQAVVEVTDAQRARGKTPAQGLAQVRALMGAGLVIIPAFWWSEVFVYRDAAGATWAGVLVLVCTYGIVRTFTPAWQPQRVQHHRDEAARLARQPLEREDTSI